MCYQIRSNQGARRELFSMTGMPDYLRVIGWNHERGCQRTSFQSHVKGAFLRAQVSRQHTFMGRPLRSEAPGHVPIVCGTAKFMNSSACVVHVIDCDSEDPAGALRGGPCKDSLARVTNSMTKAIFDLRPPLKSMPGFRPTILLGLDHKQ